MYSKNYVLYIYFTNNLKYIKKYMNAIHSKIQVDIKIQIDKKIQM